MDEILSLSSFTQPVTLVCAGNRRKEQNQVMQTVGFNWGAAGCATSLWSGPLLSEVLRKAGVKEDETWNYHCEMVGVEDLPNKVGPGPYNWPKKVKYGTSIPMSRVWNDAYSVQLSYAQNMTALMPDHGFPLRVVIPGYIGGRMIKWLSHINIIPNEVREWKTRIQGVCSSCAPSYSPSSI
jgi:nitrate reductase (NAD(P)H)